MKCTALPRPLRSPSWATPFRPAPCEAVVSDHVLSLSQNLVPCACRDSRFPPFRNERGKMGHPFVWLGWDSVGRVLGDAGSLDFARDDGLFSGLREWASRHTSAAGSRSAIAYYGTAEAVPFPRG